MRMRKKKNLDVRFAACADVIDVYKRQVFTRVMDMNDRALRNITIGLGGKVNGVPREDHFMITVASEVMRCV